MSAYSWGCRLATKVIKNIISRGRVNAARRRNRELAAAGTPVPRGRPPIRREARISTQAGTRTPPQRPQALSGIDMDRLFNEALATLTSGMTKRRRASGMPRADAIMQRSSRFPSYLLEPSAGGLGLARHCSCFCCPQRFIFRRGSHCQCRCQYGRQWQVEC